MQLTQVSQAWWQTTTSPSLTAWRKPRSLLTRRQRELFSNVSGSREWPWITSSRSIILCTRASHPWARPAHSWFRKEWPRSWQIPSLSDTSTDLRIHRLSQLYQLWIFSTLRNQTQQDKLWQPYCEPTCQVMRSWTTKLGPHTSSRSQTSAFWVHSSSPLQASASPWPPREWSRCAQPRETLWLWTSAGSPSSRTSSTVRNTSRSSRNNNSSPRRRRASSLSSSRR